MGARVVRLWKRVWGSRPARVLVVASVLAVAWLVLARDVSAGYLLGAAATGPVLGGGGADVAAHRHKTEKLLATGPPASVRALCAGIGVAGSGVVPLVRWAAARLMSAAVAWLPGAEARSTRRRAWFAGALVAGLVLVPSDAASAGSLLAAAIPAAGFGKGRPDVPGWLAEAHHAEFERVLPQLERQGLLEPLISVDPDAQVSADGAPLLVLRDEPARGLLDPGLLRGLSELLGFRWDERGAIIVPRSMAEEILDHQKQGRLREGFWSDLQRAHDGSGHGEHTDWLPRRLSAARTLGIDLTDEELSSGAGQGDPSWFGFRPRSSAGGRLIWRLDASFGSLEMQQSEERFVPSVRTPAARALSSLVATTEWWLFVPSPAELPRRALELVARAAEMTPIESHRVDVQLGSTRHGLVRVVRVRFDEPVGAMPWHGGRSTRDIEMVTNEVAPGRHLLVGFYPVPEGSPTGLVAHPAKLAAAQSSVVRMRIGTATRGTGYVVEAAAAHSDSGSGSARVRFTYHQAEDFSADTTVDWKPATDLRSLPLEAYADPDLATRARNNLVAKLAEPQPTLDLAEGRAPVDVPVARMRRTPVELGEVLTLIGHSPRGGYVIRQGPVIASRDGVVQVLAMVEGGASGGPGLDVEGQVAMTMTVGGADSVRGPGPELSTQFGKQITTDAARPVPPREHRNAFGEWTPGETEQLLAELESFVEALSGREDAELGDALPEVLEVGAELESLRTRLAHAPAPLEALIGRAARVQARFEQLQLRAMTADVTIKATADLDRLEALLVELSGGVDERRRDVLKNDAEAGLAVFREDLAAAPDADRLVALTQRADALEAALRGNVESAASGEADPADGAHPNRLARMLRRLRSGASRDEGSVGSRLRGDERDGDRGSMSLDFAVAVMGSGLAAGGLVAATALDLLVPVALATAGLGDAVVRVVSAAAPATGSAEVVTWLVWADLAALGVGAGVAMGVALATGMAGAGLFKVLRRFRQARAGETFTVVTWNIAGGRTMESDAQFGYSADEDLAPFVDALLGADADVVLLQESHTNDQDSLAERLVAELGEEWVLVLNSPASPSHIDPEYRLGNAVLMRKGWEVIDTAEHQLPDPEFPLRFRGAGEPVPPHGRVLQIVVVRSPAGGTVTVANTHTNPLDTLGYPGRYTEGPGIGHARDIEQLLLATLPRDGALVVGGDFNIDDMHLAYPGLVRELGLSEALDVPATVPWGSQLDHVLYSRRDLRPVKATATPGPSDHFLCRVVLARNGAGQC